MASMNPYRNVWTRGTREREKRIDGAHTAGEVSNRQREKEQVGDVCVLQMNGEQKSPIQPV